MASLTMTKHVIQEKIQLEQQTNKEEKNIWTFIIKKSEFT